MTPDPAGQLHILRHAHSSWALPGQRDHLRPLDERGRRDAQLVGEAMGRMGLGLTRIVCSTATRAGETLALVLPYLGPVPVEHSDDLYAHGTDAYFAAARGGGPVLLVGHNPMVEETTRLLCASGETAALGTLRDGFPTAGLATIEFADPLQRLAPGRGHLRRLLHPRELGGG